MPAGGGHRKRGFLSALGSGLANALGGMLRKKDSTEHSLPEEPVAEEAGEPQAFPVESIADEPTTDDVVSAAPEASVPQGSMEAPSAEEAHAQTCISEAAPEEADFPDANTCAQHEGKPESEPQTEPLESEALTNEGHEDAADTAPVAVKPTKPLADVDKLSLADLGIASFARSAFERFGIYMVTELLLYRREELIELRGVTQKTLSMIEQRVTSRTGQVFRLAGSLASGAQPRRMTREEMIVLDVSLSELRLSPLVMRQLRRNNIFGCRQIAFTSRDELLDHPGIDLETTYELEEALGELLGVRIVLGCDRGEPPTVVDDEPPYDWRLQKSESKEPPVPDDEEDEPVAIAPGEPMEEPCDQGEGESSVSPELTGGSNAGASTSQTEATQTDQPKGTSSVVTAGSVEEAPTTANEQLDDSSDDDDWDDVFGWDDYESEWDDESKWDWIYGEGNEPASKDDKSEPPDYQSAVGIAEWISSQGDVSGRLLLCLIDGMTKTQAATECKVPTSTVDSLVSYALNRRPPVREDEYAHAFESYAMNLEEFIDVFGQPALTYRYLSLTCEPGAKSISDILGDERIPDSAKNNLRLRLGRINPTSQDNTGGRSDAGTATGAAGMPICALDEEGLRRLRASIEAMAVFGTEYSADYFYNAQSTLMNELGIETSAGLFQLMQEVFKSSSEVTFHEDRIVRFGKADHDEQILALIEEMSPATFDDLAWQYRAKYGVDRALFRVWLHKFYRYQRNGWYDVSYVHPARRANVQGQGDQKGPEKAIVGSTTTRDDEAKVPSDAQTTETFAEDYIELPPSIRNDLRGLATAILSIAKMDTEYSTDFFYNAFPDLRRGLKAGSKRRFNDLVKLAFKGCKGVSFPSAGYFIRFGVCDRDRQIISLMREMSPVTVESLRKEYERRYGVSQSTLYGWFYCIREYRKGNTYAVEYGPAIVEPIPPEPSPVREPVEIQSAKTVHPAASPLPRTQEVVAVSEHPALTPQEPQQSGPVIDRNVVLSSIRETIDSIALADTEYSTDFFYEALPELVASIQAGSKMDFFHLVEEAYQGIEGVRFPMGHVMVFGDGDRDRQMLALLKELSPSQPMDLAIAYEKRYGFSRYLVQRWYRKFSEYLVGGYYTYEEVDAANDTGKASPIADAEHGVAPLSTIVESEEPEAEEGSVRPMGADGTPTPGSTAEDVRRAPHAKSAPKARTAIEWALSLEGIERQVMQQTLFGNPLYSVAANASLSLKETSELLTSTISKCPSVREDSFLIHFRLSKSMWEFCKSTGEPEATYHFLVWRSRVQDQKAPSDGEIEEGGKGLHSNAAEQRRQMRRAARAEGRAWWSEHADDSVQAPQGQVELRDRPTNGNQTPSPSKLAVERRVIGEVDRIATMGREYAPAYFYRSLLATMRELGIHSDDELLDVMRHAYRRDSEVSFVDGNVIRFGKCDRRRQLEGFLAEDPAATLDSFVSGYERKYGFGRMRVTRWLAEYGIDLPTGQAVEDPSLSLIQSLIPIDLPEAGLIEPQAQPVKPPTEKKQRTSRQTQMELPISTKRVGRVSRTTEYADFLRGELTADCCDRRLVVERFRARFPDGPKDPFSEKMLWRLGFRAKGKKLLFREGISYEKYFEDLIDSRVMFARGDAGFENAIFNDPQFRKILRRKMRSFAVVEYEKDSFISTAHLCDQMGVTMEDIRGYSQDVVAQLRERIGAPAPFTVWSLRNQYGIRHPLDALKVEGGMSDFVYETLFDIDPHVQCCTISKKRGFLETEGDFDTGNFIECLIEMNGPMEIDDLIDLLRDAYGIDYPELPLHHTISMSSLYYDDITDSVFNSRHEWEEMVNRELA